MSASTERKNRLAAREAGTDKKTLAAQEAEKKARVSKRKWTIGVVAVVLCIALVLLFSSPLIYRATTAETALGRNFTPADVKYITFEAKSNINYNLYANYFGQEAADEALETAVQTTLVRTAALLNYADDEGISLTAQEKAIVTDAVSEQIDQMRAAAKDNHVSLSRYMNYVYGVGVNRSVIEEGLSNSILTNKVFFAKYIGMEFTQEELDAYSTGLDANGDVFSYAFYQVTTGEDRSEEEARATAEALKNGFVESAKDSDDMLAAFNELLAEEVPGAAAMVRSNEHIDSVSVVFHDWIEDESRKAGDFEIFDGGDGSWYCVLFQERGDNNDTVVQVRHILVKAEADEDGAYTETAKAEALARAEEILSDWEAGGRDELTFASLAYLISEDSGSRANGGLYTTVRQGQMVPEFDAFCFEGHEYGDTAIVYGENGGYAGYHIMFFVGTDTARNAEAKDALLNEALESWITELSEGVEPEFRWAYKLTK